MNANTKTGRSVKRAVEPAGSVAIDPSKVSFSSDAEAVDGEAVLLKVANVPVNEILEVASEPARVEVGLEVTQSENAFVDFRHLGTLAQFDGAATVEIEGIDGDAGILGRLMFFERTDRDGAKIRAQVDGMSTGGGNAPTEGEGGKGTGNLLTMRIGDVSRQAWTLDCSGEQMVVTLNRNLYDAERLAENPVVMGMAFQAVVPEILRKLAYGRGGVLPEVKDNWWNHVLDGVSKLSSEDVDALSAHDLHEEIEDWIEATSWALVEKLKLSELMRADQDKRRAQKDKQKDDADAV